MRNHFFLAASSLLLLLGACKREEAPKPFEFPEVELRLTQVGKTPYPNEAVMGLNGIHGVPDASGAVPTMYSNSGKWRKWTFQEGTQRLKLGRLDLGSRPGVLIYYKNGGEPNYVYPAAGEYIEAEVFVGGKSQGIGRVDRSCFGTPFPCNRITDGNGVHIFSPR